MGNVVEVQLRGLTGATRVTSWPSAVQGVAKFSPHCPGKLNLCATTLSVPLALFGQHQICGLFS